MQCTIWSGHLPLKTAPISMQSRWHPRRAGQTQNLFGAGAMVKLAGGRGMRPWQVLNARWVPTAVPSGNALQEAGKQLEATSSRPRNGRRNSSWLERFGVILIYPPFCKTKKLEAFKMSHCYLWPIDKQNAYFWIKWVDILRTFLGLVCRKDEFWTSLPRWWTLGIGSAWVIPWSDVEIEGPPSSSPSLAIGPWRKCKEEKGRAVERGSYDEMLRRYLYASSPFTWCEL